jgi:hypothetical protein
MEDDHVSARPRVNVWVMSGTDIRTYTPQNKPALEAFIRRVWASDAEIESHLPKQDSVTFLAFEGNQLLGMMTRYERSFHPHTTTLEFGFDPELDDHFRRQLETELFDRITTDVAKTRIFRVQFLEHQSQEIRFLRENRFLEMRRTWMPSVNVSSLPATLFEDDLRVALGRGFSIRRLDELQNDSELMLRLAEANRDHYLATHSINPPRECDLNRWHKIAYGEDLIPQAAFVALENDQIAAFSSLCDSESDDACDIAWFASTAAYTADSRMLNRALKAKELGYARTHEIANLCFEFDSTDPQAMALLETMPIDPGLALITFQTGIPSV